MNLRLGDDLIIPGVIMPITDYLQECARAYSKNEAIVFIEKSIDLQNKHDNYLRSILTWKELYEMSNKISNLLLANKINKGDKVAILLKNSLEWLPIYFGILNIGAVAVPINYNNSVEEICYCIEFADCIALFYSAEDEMIDRIITEINYDLMCFNATIIETIVASFQGVYLSNDIQVFDNDVAAIYFSSGTTGRSKAIVLSHKALMASSKMELSHHFQTHKDCFLCLSPLYHTGSKIHWFGSLIVGGSIVIFNDSSPRSIYQVLYDEKITIAFLLVPQIQDILDAIDCEDICLENKPLTNLRLMHSGAQPIPQALILRWKKRFPYVQYDTNYGLTESAGPGCIHLGINNWDKLGAIGVVDEFWKAKIIDQYDEEVATEIVGELVVNGPGIMQEYYKDPISTDQVLRDGWLHTGDLAYKDSDDFIYLVGRKKDVIISGGENIYPVQIEEFIRKLDVVKDVAIIGISNKRMGEVVAAIIEPKLDSNYSRENIYCYLRKLPPYQRPYKIVFAPVLRNATGKIDKQKLYDIHFKKTLSIN